MTELEEARQFALSLPEATEEPHFDKASFRVGGRIFATVPPDEQHLHVFVDAEEAHAAAVAGDSTAFGELWWGKQLKGVRVSLPAAAPERVAELLEVSWRRRASKRLVAAFDAARAG